MMEVASDELRFGRKASSEGPVQYGKGCTSPGTSIIIVWDYCFCACCEYAEWAAKVVAHLVGKLDRRRSAEIFDRVSPRDYRLAHHELQLIVDSTHLTFFLFVR